MGIFPFMDRFVLPVYKLCLPWTAWSCDGQRMNRFYIICLSFTMGNVVKWLAGVERQKIQKYLCMTYRGQSRWKSPPAPKKQAARKDGSRTCMGSAPFMFRYPFMYGAEPYMNRQFPRSGTNICGRLWLWREAEESSNYYIHNRAMRTGWQRTDEFC